MRLIVCFLLFSSLWVSSALCADTECRLEVKKGKVRLHHQTWQELKKDSKTLLGKQVKLHTQANSSASILFHDKSKIELGPSTYLILFRDTSKILLFKGAIKVHQVGAQMQIETLSSSVSVQPGKYEVLTKEGKTIIKSQSGKSPVIKTNYAVKRIPLGQQAYVKENGMLMLKKGAQ